MSNGLKIGDSFASVIQNAKVVDEKSSSHTTPGGHVLKQTTRGFDLDGDGTADLKVTDSGTSLRAQWRDGYEPANGVVAASFKATGFSSDFQSPTYQAVQLMRIEAPQAGGIVRYVTEEDRNADGKIDARHTLEKGNGVHISLWEKISE